MRRINRKLLFLIICIFFVLIIGVGLVYRSVCQKKAGEKSKEDSLKTDEWLLTQYGDMTGEQSCVYTLTTTDKLIVIDGGWKGNQAKLRDIIEGHNNHVDAWIISHPHRDHAGAFIEIMSDLNGITIDKIYDNNYDYDFVMSVGEPYDDITIMQEFYELTHELDNIIHMNRNQEYDICGLSVKVFNCFDDNVKENVGKELDYQNNASLCLKITNKSESFLFTSDIKKDMKDYLYKTYGEELKADYVQLSHHGNWGFSKKMYDKTGASVFFLDAPQSISDNEEYPANSLKKYLTEADKTVYDYETSPNSIILR